METQAFLTEADAIAFCRDNGFPISIERSGVAFIVSIPTIEGTAVEVIPTVESEPPQALDVVTTVENIGDNTFEHTDPDDEKPVPSKAKK